MDISYYENEVKRYTDEIAKLEQELVTLHNSGNADSFTYSVMPKDEFLREEANINNHIETARAKIEENNKVINAYNNIINNINALRSLNDSNPDYNHPEVKEELERRSREIEEAKKILPSEIVDSINRTLGARTIDGVKRRCRPGCGRCQGGFCGPRVQEIISRETGMNIEEVLLDKNGSYIISGKTK